MSKIRATAVLLALLGFMFATEAQAAFQRKLRLDYVWLREAYLTDTVNPYKLYAITICANLRTAEVQTNVSPTFDAREFGPVREDRIGLLGNPNRDETIADMTSDEYDDVVVFVAVMNDRSGNQDDLHQMVQSATRDRIRALAPYLVQASGRQSVINEMHSNIQRIIRNQGSQDELLAVLRMNTGVAPAPGPETSWKPAAYGNSYGFVYTMTMGITNGSTAPQSPGGSGLFGGGSPGSGSDGGQPGTDVGGAPRPATTTPQIDGTWSSNIGLDYNFYSTSTGFRWETTDFFGRPQIGRGRFLPNNRFEASWYDERGNLQGRTVGTVGFDAGNRAVSLRANNGVRFSFVGRD